jgi:phage tail protein X
MANLAPNLSLAETTAAVSAALAANPGLSPVQVQAAVSAAIAANPGLTQEQVQTAVSAALAANPGLTADQVEAAVKAALNDATGVTEPTEQETVIPEKLSLTTVMQSFVTSINDLPMLQTLRGLTINCGGSSVLCLSMGSLGSKCWDAAPLSGTLNGIGTAFLGLTTLFSFVGIFRG